MNIIESKVKTQSQEFTENRKRMLALVSELKERLSSVREGGSSQSVELHQSRGKLTVHQRIDSLIDPNSPFLELSPLAAWGMYDDQINQIRTLTVERDAANNKLLYPNGITRKISAPLRKHTKP